MRESLQYWYDAATLAQRHSGQRWYQDAHRDAQRIADEYNIDVHVVVAILSILSVGVRWAHCKESVYVALLWWRQGKALVSQGAYSVQLEKVRRVLEEMPNDSEMLPYIGSKRALKTRAFYQCLMRPLVSQAVVVDRWIYHAADLHMKKPPNLMATYREISAIIRDIAEREGLLPSQAQATIWVSIRQAYKGKWRKERT